MTSETNDTFPSVDDCSELASLMTTKYRNYLDQRQINVVCSSADESTFVTVTVKSPDAKFVYPIEARILHEQEEKLPREAALFLVDFIDLYLEEYFVDEDEERPYLTIDWSDFDYDAIKFQMRGQIVNKSIEDQASEWLTRAGFSVDGQSLADLTSENDQPF